MIEGGTSPTGPRGIEDPIAMRHLPRVRCDATGRVRWRNRLTGSEEEQAISHLFLFIGAEPAASWLAGCGIPLDKKGFVRTGADVRSNDRELLSLETGVEGMFAIGDVRCGSVKRVGASIGEGMVDAPSVRNQPLRESPRKRRRIKRFGSSPFMTAHEPRG